MNTSGRLQSQREALRAALTLLENRSIHDSMNLPKMNSILLKVLQSYRGFTPKF